MKKKQTIFIILVTFILLIFVCLIISNIVTDKNEFKITTRTNKYTESNEDVKGFPIYIKCNKNEKVKIIISKGKIIDDSKNILKINDTEYISSCNQEVYWSPKDSSEIEVNEEIIIEINLQNTSEYKNAIRLQRNELNEYVYIKENN